MRENELRDIFEKTDGHCHFCGDPIVFEKRRGKRVENPKGYWEVDHVFQRARGGKSEDKNHLPACTQCNKLRWDRKGEDLRELLILGLIAKEEIDDSKSKIGSTLRDLATKRINRNKRRRTSNK